MTKEQLKTYRFIKLEHDHLEGLLTRLECTLYGPRSQRLDGMPRSGSAEPGSAVEDAAIKHAAVLEKYQQKVAELAVALAEIENAIEGLDPRERTLVRLYYAEGMTWEEVCVAMSYSWRQIHRIHGQALQKLKSREETAAKCD